MRAFYFGHNAGLMTAVGFFGWFTGSLYERYKIQKSAPSGNLPGLPVFGTVSAATPITPHGSTEDRVVNVQKRTSEIMKYGFPSLSDIKSYSDFVLSFDKRTRVANWVFEHMTAERLQYNKDIDRSLCDFVEDNSTHPYFRATNKDYKGSGFDRGHLAAAGNHRLSQEDVAQTFMLTNIAPQVGVGFNRHSWNQLEKYVRSLTKHYANVYVCTGPLYLPYWDSNDKKTYVKYQVIGSNNVAVPTHFFKVVVLENKSGQLELEVYVMPNRPIEDGTKLTNFLVPPDVVERNAGILFFDSISQKRLVKINGVKNTLI